MQFRLLLIIVPALILIGAVSATAVLAADDGKVIFVENQKCDMCHAVKAAGIEAKTKSEAMKGPDLTGVATRHKADWISGYVTGEILQNDKKHRKLFKGTDEELKTLVDWLLEQKAE